MASIEVPSAWKKLDVAALAGTIIVIGQTDTGKSTFAHWLVAELCRHHERVGWLDADVGQNTLGVPTTLNLAVVAQSPIEPPAPDVSFFVGNTSPRGHMLPTIVGAHKLQQRAQKMGAGAIVVDTTGLVAQETGGGALKLWKIELLQPENVVAIQRHGELVHILMPLVRDARLTVHTLSVAEAVNRKTIEERQARRRQQYRRYFAGASTVSINYSRLPVYDLEQAGSQQLLALQGDAGFVIELGVIQEMSTEEMHIVTPLDDMGEVDSLRVGSLRLNPESGEELR